MDEFCAKSGTVKQYKTPTTYDKWFTREDPITIYFTKDVTNAQLEELYAICKPYIRQDIIESSVGLNYKKGMSLAYETSSLSSQYSKELCDKIIKRAENINKELGREVRRIVYHKYVDKYGNEYIQRPSSGQFAALEKMLDDIEGKQTSSLLSDIIVNDVNGTPIKITDEGYWFSLDEPDDEPHTMDTLVDIPTADTIAPDKSINEESVFSSFSSKFDPEDDYDLRDYNDRDAGFYDFTGSKNYFKLKELFSNIDFNLIENAHPEFINSIMNELTKYEYVSSIHKRSNILSLTDKSGMTSTIDIYEFIKKFL